MGEIYVPGRLEKVSCGNNIRIFVDYAHTEGALRNILLTLGKIKGRGRLIVVFGCGGNRDKRKRPRMGAVAVKLSDYAIITSDNPRNEDPKEIVKDIIKGINPSFKNFKVVLDRRRAIEEIILEAQDNDIVLIAGKGHEEYQIIKEKRIPFSDAEIAKEYLKAKIRCLV